MTRESDSSPPLRVRAFIGLQHGVHGQPSNLHPMRDLISREIDQFNVNAAACNANIRVTFFDTSKNSFLKSLQGTVKCGERLLKESIRAIHAWLAEADVADTAIVNIISLVGHSFGSILWREVLPSLVADPTIARYNVKFASFLSIASPHCGAHNLGSGLSGAAVALGNLVSTTYLDLLHKTDVLGTRLLSDVHLAALRRVKHRTLVANVTNDMFVRFESASLCYPDIALVKHDGDGKAAAMRALEANGVSAEPIDPMFPHVLSMFTVGSEDASRSPVSPTPPGSPTSVMITKEARCAHRLCGGMTWLVIPIMSKSSTPSAHKAIIGKSRFGADMTDAMLFVTKRFVSELIIVAADGDAVRAKAVSFAL